MTTAYLHTYSPSWGWVYAADPRSGYVIPKQYHQVFCHALHDWGSDNFVPVDESGKKVAEAYPYLSDEVQYFREKTSALDALKAEIKTGKYNLRGIERTAGLPYQTLRNTFTIARPLNAETWWKVLKAMCPVSFDGMTIASTETGFKVMPLYPESGSPSLEINTLAEFSRLFAP